MFHDNIKHLAKENNNFRKVIYTGKNAQLVLMNIVPGDEIGEETHETTDQLLFFVDGEGTAIIGGQEFPVHEHDVVFVPAGTLHNFKNTGHEDLKLYTVYAPPAHKYGTIQATHNDAMKENL